MSTLSMVAQIASGNLPVVYEWSNKPGFNANAHIPGHNELPLHTAAYYRNAQLVHHFLKLGGNPLIKAHHGNAFEAIPAGKFNDHEIPFIKFMLEQGSSRIAATLDEAREQFRRSRLPPAEVAALEAKEKEQAMERQLLIEARARLEAESKAIKEKQKLIQQKLRDHYSRDQKIAEILNDLEIPAASQLQLFEAGLAAKEIPFITKEQLISLDVPVLKAGRLLDCLRAHSASSMPPLTPSPSNPASSSTTPNDNINHFDISLPLVETSFSQPQLILPSELCSPIKSLGSGAFGTVYIADYKGTSVAVKKLKVNKPEYAADFLKEVNMMTNLRSSQLVNLIGICLEPLIIVMELMGGGSLFDLLHNSASIDLPWAKKIHVLCEIARGIQFLRHHSVAHRDLKPHNILLSEDHKQVKLADFGFSRKVNSMTGMLESLSLRGTHLYMAPELLPPSSASGINGFLCDIYAFGIIMWEVGYRKKPFFDLDPKYITEFPSKVVNENLRPSIDLQAGLSHDFVALMMQCWDHDPSRRPNIDEVVGILPRCQDQLPGSNPYIPLLDPYSTDSINFKFGSAVAGPSNPPQPSSSSQSSFSIVSWLSGLGLDQYIPVFQAAGITTLRRVKVLTNEILRDDLSIQVAGDRLEILHAINELKQFHLS